MKTIKVGVIGYGGAYNMGRGHLNQMRAAGMTPTAVAEIDPARLEVARTDFPGIQTYPSAARMLRDSDVELVAIITPHNTHARLAVQCLEAGRHVVCEKPMAITTAECDRMIGAARRHKRLVTAYHNRHWDGCVVNALKLVRQGKIGDVYRVEAHMGGWRKPGPTWRGSKTISGGILYDWGVHLLEYTLQIMNARIAEVTGFAHTGFWAKQSPWKKDANEDEGHVVVRYEDGRWSSLCLSHLDSNPKKGMLEVTGTKGTLIVGGKEWELVAQRRKGEPLRQQGPNPPSEHGRFYQNIAAHLMARKPLVITPEWARRPIHILDLACRSARLGRSLKARYE